MPHTRKEILAIGKMIADKIFHKKKVEEVTVKGWVARNKDNDLRFYTEKPLKRTRYWIMPAPKMTYRIPECQFPSVKWSDPKPTPVTLTIKIENAL